MVRTSFLRVICCLITWPMNPLSQTMCFYPHGPHLTIRRPNAEIQTRACDHSEKQTSFIASADLKSAITVLNSLSENSQRLYHPCLFTGPHHAPEALFVLLAASSIVCYFHLPLVPSVCLCHETSSRTNRLKFPIPHLSCI